VEGLKASLADFGHFDEDPDQPKSQTWIYIK
jgi:hypothetical protein